MVQLISGRDNISVGKRKHLDSDSKTDVVNVWFEEIPDDFTVYVCGKEYVGDSIEVMSSNVYIDLEYSLDEPVPTGRELNIKADDPSGDLTLEIRG